MKKIISVLLVAALLLSLTACAELFSQIEDKVEQLDLNKVKDVTLDMGDSLKDLWNKASELTAEEKAKLEKLMEDYQKLEEKAITEVEGLIEKLPKPEQISAAHEGLITGARKAYDALPEDIRAKISNIDVLEELEKVLEKVKETAPQNG